ncbi:hypothetical protein [Methylocystis rosea]|jgi:hypothetical protein|uniref:Uncharacterized protein n=1 Tax=Methylocystis rosea TaxID=173366 RepID=A0A3G8MCY4_9HYPH|nr:hypothetical protein [Methylocystis rosea]AZG78982.1 hypothetical protein EHO51_19390 [Methylocystis rosea]
MRHNLTFERDRQADIANGSPLRAARTETASPGDGNRLPRRRMASGALAAHLIRRIDNNKAVLSLVLASAAVEADPIKGKTDFDLKTACLEAIAALRAITAKPSPQRRQLASRPVAG